MSHDAQFSSFGLPFSLSIHRRRPTLEEIVRQDGRYPLAAYHFVFEALDYGANLYGKERDSPCEEGRHVTGQQLLEGVRRYALEQFGYMARVVFSELNIHCTADFGRIVFFLVAHGLMGKTDRDCMDDFVDQYDFEQVFERDFVFDADDADLSITTPYFATSA